MSERTFLYCVGLVIGSIGAGLIVEAVGWRVLVGVAMFGVGQELMRKK